jgi:hypothetical protein
MMNTVITLSFMVAYVTLACYIAWKVLMYLIDKINNLITGSRIFTMAMFATFSALCFVVGLYQLSGYRAGEDLEFSQHFPLAFGLALVFMVAIYFAYKKPKWRDDE